MRRLFVPACLCLMTISGSTGPDPRPVREEFSGHSPVEAAMPREDAFAIIAIPTDRVIEMPIQAALEPMLEPQAAPAQSAPKPVFYRARQEVCDVLVKAAEKNDLPIPYFIRLLFQESGFRPDVVSRAGAQGVAQFMPETAADVGLDNPFDPLEAIPASARLLRGLFQQFGNLGLAAAAYNAGPKRIEAWLSKKGTLPPETQGYVKSITGRPAENWKVAAAGTPEIKLPRRAPCQDAAGLLAWDGPPRIPMPLPSPHTHAAAALRGPARPAKNARGAVQLAARKSASRAKHEAKGVHATHTPTAQRLRLASATHAARK